MPKAARSTISARTRAAMLPSPSRARPGAKLVIEHAEVLDHIGQFDRESMRSAEARVEYVLKGGGPESYRPTFTFFGFRYARVAIDGKARITDIEMIPISSAIDADRGVQLGASRWSTGWSRTPSGRSARNFIDVPTDCPQRDERLGWTGRRAGLRRDRLLPAREPRHPAQVRPRHDRGPARRRRHPARRPRPVAQS